MILRLFIFFPDLSLVILIKSILIKKKRVNHVNGAGELPSVCLRAGNESGGEPPNTGRRGFAGKQLYNL